ncbi:MAG: phosphoglycerate mutase [Chloroflexi bacterium HGW-Chloroflexi-5]|jgi:probable phosphoglycerate mutase|nr:MAG: phosphoglycerate mutase [Chloroflexi bacterium HGW-Chloroflexi-5]
MADALAHSTGTGIRQKRTVKQRGGVMAIIYLVRHGRTDFIGKKLCGNLPGIHLNEEGRVQAQKAAGYLSNLPIKAIYSSPIERAMETAQIIGSKSGLEIDPVDFLREIHFGDLQGMGGKDLTDHPLWIKFNSQPGDIHFPNGESVSEVYDRVSKGLGLISQQYDKEDQIACVAHSDVLRLAVCWVLGLPLDHFHRLTIDPASISKIEITPELKKLRLLNLQPD